MLEDRRILRRAISCSGWHFGEMDWKAGTRSRKSVFPCQIHYQSLEMKARFSHLSMSLFPNTPTSPKLLLTLPLVPVSRYLLCSLGSSDPLQGTIWQSEFLSGLNVCEKAEALNLEFKQFLGNSLKKRKYPSMWVFWHSKCFCLSPPDQLEDLLVVRGYS